MKRPLAYRLPIRVRSKAVWLAVIVLAMLSMPAQSQQSRKELERQRKEKESEIKLTKKLLKETQAKHKETLQYLQTLNKQIRSREELIGTMQNEVHALTDYIARESEVVGAMDNDLAEMRKEYGRVLYFMYKNRSSLDILSFLFSANSFNQAVKRYKFIRFYANYRQKQVDLITRTQKAIAAKVTDLKIQQSLKEQVVTDMGIQKQEWEQDKVEKDKLAKKLQGDENKLRKQLKEKQKVAAKLDKAIRDIIAKEIAAENKKNAANKTGNKTVDSKGEKKKTSSGELSMTPEMEKLSNEFASNRSRLPWPVEKGFISERYGTHEHPTLDHVMVNNNGIKIRTSAGASARCIFSGEVRNIIRIPGANISVIVKHGAYYTVYSNLASVNVKPGDKVSTKQVIGTVAENSINGETELELQIWKGSTKLDPEGWIYIR